MKMFSMIAWLLIASGLILPAAGLSQEAAAGLLPVDDNVTLGRLDNGLTYYIRENKKPENRAFLRLVINAGSILEDEDQRGLAHFLEHMAFNGTAHFQKQELIDYLLSIGMRFGADLNAHTSFDETIYKLQVPSDDLEALGKAFLILEDWASNINLEPEEIDKERGVIVEEWRGSQGVQWRIINKQLPIIFEGSRYAERLAIGDMKVINNAQRDVFERFYRDWYRPDLMAVVAVGDFKKADIEALIHKHFAKIPMVKNPPERKTFPVPDHEGTYFSIETDPELTRSMIQIMSWRPFENVTTEADLRKNIVSELAEGMLNQRIRERTKDANPPFLFAYSGSQNGYVRGKSALIKAAMVKEGGFEEGLTALIAESKRARQFGFTTSEMERLKKDTMRGLERAFTEREKTHSSRYVGLYERHFLEGNPIMGIENVLELYKRILPGITLAEVNASSKTEDPTDNRVIMVTAPQKEGLKIPNKEDILAILKNADSMKVEPYQDDVTDQPLLAQLPTPGEIVSRTTITELDTHILRFANGVRVVLKATDFKNDEIRFSAFSPGGSSLASDAEYIAAITATTLADESGVGAFDLIQLEKMLTGKVVSISPYIGEFSEGFSGGAAPDDLETMFQLLYLYFTAPRMDTKAFESTKTKWRTAVENRDVNPSTIYSDEIRKTLYNDHPRRQPFTTETLEKLDREASLRIFKDRFADAGDFTFIFVGNFEIGAMEKQLARYVGSLPANGRKETIKDNQVRYAKGKLDVSVRKGLEPKADVRITYTGAATWKSENRLALWALNYILEIRLREILREEMGGIYGVSVGGAISNQPLEQFRTTITFTCDPENVEKLVKAIYDELAVIQEKGIGDDYVAKAKEARLRSYETGMKQNGFWLSNLEFYYENGLDPKNILTFPQRLDFLSGDVIRKAAQTYYSGKNRLYAVLRPEAKSTGAEN